MSDNVVNLRAGPSRLDASIPMARVQAGASPIELADKGVNDTYYGEILTETGAVIFAYIKDLDARELANELTAAALGKMIGAPVPQSYLALANSVELPLSKAPAIGPDLHLVFASADAAVPSLKKFYDPADQTVYEALRKRIAEWEDVGILYGFDTMFANTDRNIGNILIGAHDFWFIDHGRCFTGPAWDPAALDPALPYNNKISSWLTPSLTDAQRARAASVAAVAGTVEDAQLDALFDLCHVVDLLDDAQKVGLLSFLKARRAHLSSLTADALGLVA